MLAVMLIICLVICGCSNETSDSEKYSDEQVKEVAKDEPKTPSENIFTTAIDYIPADF